MKRVKAILLAVCLLLSISAPVFAVEEEMHISDAGLEFIARYEGFRSTPYYDGGSWYIGYGTACDPADYPEEITQEQAFELMRSKTDGFDQRLNRFLAKYGAALTQNQFDAMISLTYTLSSNWMTMDYSLGRYVVYGGYDELGFVNSIGSWCHAGGTFYSRLAQRRIDEARLFLYGDYQGDWAPQYVYVNFDANGGSMESDVQYYALGEPYGALPQVQKAGETLQGWLCQDGSALTEFTVAEENEQVLAQWSGGTVLPTDPDPVVPPVTEVSFSDVTEDSWYYTYLTELVAAGVVGGYPDGSFRPERATTCGETLKLITVNAGYSEQVPVSEHWASGYLRLAEVNGWVEAGELRDLDAPVSRLTVARIAAKALGLSKVYTTSPYEDTADGYALAMYRVGLLVGSQVEGKTYFYPQQSIKRSELCTLIWRMRNTDLHQGEVKYAGKWYPIDPSVAANSYDIEGFVKDSRGYMTYSDSRVDTVLGLDVSSHQGEIDWQQVASAGMEFAMIRLGFRGYETGSLNLDSYFQQNLTGAQMAGIKTGVYIFSQATTVEEALEEADFVLENLAGRPLQYPVVFDWETVNSSSARTKNMTKEMLTACALAFCQRIESAGYTPMIYFGQNVAYPLYDLSQVDQYDFWLAMYSDYPAFVYDFQMWQYTSNGKVPGISTRVDLNIAMKRFA